MSKKNFEFEVKESKEFKTLVSNLTFDPKQYNLRWEMPEAGELIKMVRSLRSEGQKQAITVMNEGGKLITVIGFCRHLAMKEVNRQERAEGVDETPIRFSIAPKQELEKIFLGNIAENEIRYPLSPMDKAWGMKRLQDEFKMDQSQIAERFNVSQASVSNYLKLFTLSETIQKDVHSGMVSFSQAMLLFKIPEHKRDEVVKEAKANPSGSSKLDNVPTGSGEKEGKAHVNTGKLKDAAQKVAKTTYAKSITDFKNFCMVEDCETPTLNLSAIKVLNTLFDWFTGTIDEKKLKKVLNDNTLE